MDEFDLQRIFWGDTSAALLLEIIFRTTVLFVFTLLMMRMVGHRGIGQLSMTEFIIVIALGSAVGDPMFYADIPLVHGMLVIFLITVYQVLVSTLSMRSRTVAKFEEGTAIRLVVDGMVDLDGLEQARLTREELFAELRQYHVRELGEVERAFLEVDGKVSVFRFAPEMIEAGLPLMPDGDRAANHQTILSENKYACGYCGYTTRVNGASLPDDCPRCHHQDWTEAHQTKKSLVNS